MPHTDVQKIRKIATAITLIQNNAEHVRVPVTVYNTSNYCCLYNTTTHLPTFWITPYQSLGKSA